MLTTEARTVTDEHGHGHEHDHVAVSVDVAVDVRRDSTSAGFEPCYDAADSRTRRASSASMARARSPSTGRENR